MTGERDVPGRERGAPAARPQPRLLALETSSATGSVALAVGGELRERTIPTPREQTELVLPFVAELLAEAQLQLGDLDALVFGRGPGSFTGLRIAAALAQGFAMAAGRPLVAVSSLAALAARARREHGVGRVVTCVDARMGEVYWAAYALDAATGLMRLEGEERLASPAALAAEAADAAEAGGWYAAGSGWERYAEALGPIAAGAAGVDAGLVPAARDLLPQAEAELAAGRVLAPEQALPVYLRSESAWRRLPT